MRHLAYAILAIFLPLSVRAALPGDAAAGKRLVDAHCTACHDSSVYARPDRRIHSLDALRHQVQGCSHMAKKNFSAAEAQDILKYLNDGFYKFK